MCYKNKKGYNNVMNLTKITTDNLIAIIGTLLTVITIGVSVFQFSKDINQSVVEAKQKMALDQTSQLPLEVAQFCTSSSNVAVGIFLGPDTLDDESRTEFELLRTQQVELQVKIKERIIAYGSDDAIKIFSRFEDIVRNPVGGQIDIEVYYLLPLLMAQVKADVTGEMINPITFFHLLMPQFINHDDKAIQYINKTIADLELDGKLTAFKEY